MLNTCTIKHKRSSPDTRADIECPYAPCYILTARKEKGSNPNFSPVCSDQRLDVQTKKKISYSLSILTAGPRRKSWNLLTSPLQELKLFDKQTSKHQSTIDITTLFISFLFLSFLHQMKNKRDITTCKTKKDFKCKKLLGSCSDLSWRVSP